MRIFIDTNIYLSFIHKSNDNLKSAEELVKLLGKDDSLRLVFPKITQDEFFRNLPRVTETYCKELKSFIPNKVQFASLIKDKNLSSKIQKAYEEYRKLIKDLPDSYKKNIKNFEKNIIVPLIKKAENIHENDETINRAYTRRLKGNPPGKEKGPIGDEIEWELLVSRCFDDDLTIVSEDADWKSYGSKDLHPLLLGEWKVKTNKKIKIFNTLGEFINFYTEEEKISKEEIIEEKKAALEVELSPRIYFPNELTVGNNISSGSLTSLNNEPITISNLSNMPAISAFMGLSYCPSCFEPKDHSRSNCKNCGNYYGTT